MTRSDVRQFRVLPVSLGGPDRREVLPMLIDRNTWLPPRLPVRWAVRRRRWECMPNTLASNLRALGLLYEWAARMHEGDMDTLLERGLHLDGIEIEALIAYLRSRALDEELSPSTVTEARTLHTLANIAWPIREFLKWAADPQARGGRGTIDPRDLAVYRLRLDFAFQPAVRRSGMGMRIQPLTSAQDACVQQLVGVVMGSDGRVKQPFCFHPANPFAPETRLRNWLMYQIARELGLRRSELLALYYTDAGAVLSVRRRPNDRHDERRQPAYVKAASASCPRPDSCMPVSAPTSRHRRRAGDGASGPRSSSSRPLAARRFR